MKTVTLQELKDQFNLQLKTVEAPERFIDNEINEIERFVRYQDREVKRQRGEMFAIQSPKPIHVFKLEIGSLLREDFGNSFLEYHSRGTKKNSKEFENEFQKNTSEQAYEFVNYYLWLKDVRTNLTGKTKGVMSTLNLEQKMLALLYLGLDLRDFNNKQTAKVLGQILNVGEENIRKNLSNLHGGKNNVRSSENLSKLIEIFDNQTFDSISNRIKREIKES